MKIRSLNSDNDITLGSSQINISSDGLAVVQSVRSRLLFYLEEWFLDTSEGLPYFQEFLKKPANLTRIESRIKAEIIATDGVLSLISFEYDFNKLTRKLNIKFSAVTIFGDVSGELPINIK